MTSSSSPLDPEPPVPFLPPACDVLFADACIVLEDPPEAPFASFYLPAA